jgi:hypothetical protein
MRGGRQKENPIKSQAELLLWATQLVPEARAYLQANNHVANQLDAMPPMQIVLLYKWKQYEELRDECIKWGMLPVNESRETFKAEQDRVTAKVKDGIGVPFSDGLPPLIPTFVAQLRSQRRINLFRAVEALRMYAAEHGRWPTRLEDVTQVPVPSDPLMQKPFGYSPGENVCMLSAPSGGDSPNATGATRVELVLRSKESIKGKSEPIKAPKP